MTANHGLPPDFPERRTRAQPAEPPFAAAMYRVRAVRHNDLNTLYVF
jgi:hypothetical protein